VELQKLTLSNFRSYSLKEFLFSPQLTCVEGENGSGKSNLLEAIYLISTGKSFRTHRLFDLIQHKEETFTLKAHFLKDDISHTLTICFGKEGRKVLYDNTSYNSFLPLLGLLPSVLLSPEDISILNGGPAERRRFLDLHLAQIDPLYVQHLGRYQRALKQRNLLLKRKEPKGILAWEELMAISASYLVEKRLETVHYLQEPSNALVLELSMQKEPFSMLYENSSSSLQHPLSPDLYMEKWAETRSKELEAGTTLIGPHRDNIVFSLKEKELKLYGSEGQKRCCLAALRLAEWQRLKEVLKSPPLFGIDDFGVHLDKQRSSLLKEALKEMGQVFLTAPSFSSKENAHFLYTSKTAAESTPALAGTL
jgi:DNA replication and repair protein RecF